jgi:hypothetical protein
VSNFTDLERRYRRWLTWYPTSFRREYEDEIVGVLIAGARDGQRFPEAMNCLDLMSHGLRLRLRQVSVGSGPSITKLMPLLGLGALLEFVAAISILATAGDIRANTVSANLQYTDAQWSAVLADQLEPVALAASAAAVAWLVLAWGIARGHRSAGLALAALLVVNVLSLTNSLAQGSARYAQADTAIAIALCGVQFLAVVLVLRALFGGQGRRTVRARSHRDSAPQETAHE